MKSGQHRLAPPRSERPTLRAAFLASGVLLGAAALAAGWGSLVACDNLSETSPLPDGDASDLDAGYTPPLPEEAGPPDVVTIDTGAPPASGRIRLANLLNGAGAVDLCTRSETATAWDPQKITTNPSGAKAEGLLFGEVSAHIFLSASTAGTRYQFRVVPLGTPCDGDGGVPIVAIPVGTNTTLRQNGGLTIIAAGTIKEGTDAGDGNPRGAVIADTLSPPSSAALVRVVHGVPDLAAFDAVVNGETILTGIKYGSAIQFPYTSTTGFASVAAGIPEGSTLTLKAGTSAQTYIVPDRVRRGVATTIFVGGTADKLTVSLCSDRSPPANQTVAECKKLKEAQ